MENVSLPLKEVGVSTKAKSQAAGLGNELHSEQHIDQQNMQARALKLKHVAEPSTLACKAEEVDRCEAKKGVWRIEDCKRRGRQCISATSTLTVEQNALSIFKQNSKV